MGIKPTLDPTPCPPPVPHHPPHPVNGTFRLWAGPSQKRSATTLAGAATLSFMTWAASASASKVKHMANAIFTGQEGNCPLLWDSDHQEVAP
jgi:hypothetical protein